MSNVTFDIKRKARSGTSFGLRQHQKFSTNTNKQLRGLHPTGQYANMLFLDNTVKRSESLYLLVGSLFGKNNLW